MTDLVEITKVEPREDRWVRLWFSDGAVTDVDLGPLLARGGVFTEVRDHRASFEAVRVNPDSHTIEWPGDLDLDVRVLHGDDDPASGVRLGRRAVGDQADLTKLGTPLKHSR